MMNPVQDYLQGVTQFSIRVTPNASRSRVVLEEGSDGKPFVKVYVTSPPEDGKANQAVCRILAKALGIPRSHVCITRGLKGRDKWIEILK